jgi:hypothetical protein
LKSPFLNRQEIKLAHWPENDQRGSTQMWDWTAKRPCRRRSYNARKMGDGGRTGTVAAADRPQLALLCEEFSATLVTSPQPPNASFPALLPSLVRQAHKTKVSAGQLLSWTQLALREKAVLALVQYKALTDSSGYSNPGLIGPCSRVFVLGLSKYYCSTGTRPGYSQARLQGAIQVFNTWKRGGLTSRVTMPGRT